MSIIFNNWQFTSSGLWCEDFMWTNQIILILQSGSKNFRRFFFYWPLAIQMSVTFQPQVSILSLLNYMSWSCFRNILPHITFMPVNKISTASQLHFNFHKCWNLNKFLILRSLGKPSREKNGNSLVFYQRGGTLPPPLATFGTISVFFPRKKPETA